MPWERGSAVVVRSRPDGVVGYTFPAIVVRDSPELVALFQPAGSVCKRRTGTRGGPSGRNMISWDGSYEDVVRQISTVHVWSPDDAFWLIRTWNGASYEGWYINLADPLRRTSIGFDTVDRILDVVVAVDRSNWRWKDEDELAWAVTEGRFTVEQAAGFRRDAVEAIARMEAWQPPFNLDGLDLDPDPDWVLPVLPKTWAREP